MNTMKWLIQREYWEGKGGFLWAPVIMGAIAILFAIAGTVFGTVEIGQHADAAREMHAQDIAEMSAGAGMAGDIMLMVGVGLTSLVLSFVVFFYSLGSLYDDRRDRSILFWKSMPISDTQMVLSKAAWALALAPVLSVAIGLVLGLALWLIGGVGSMINDVPGASGLLTHSHPFRVLAMMVAALPVQMVWSLPAVGWLMFCSAASPRFPFLWATMLPILLATMISFTDLFGIDVNHEKVWYVLIGRGLASVVPGSWAPTLPERNIDFDGPQDFVQVLDITQSWEVFASPDAWIGAVIGAALIFAAIRLRRWRDEG